MKSLPLLRTTKRPARSSDNTNRSAAATPTPMPISSEPRRQKLRPTNTKAAAKISPTNRIGHWASQDGPGGHRCSASSTTLVRRNARVSGPTPPGFGDT